MRKSESSHNDIIFVLCPVKFIGQKSSDKEVEILNLFDWNKKISLKVRWKWQKTVTSIIIWIRTSFSRRWKVICTTKIKNTCHLFSRCWYFCIWEEYLCYYSGTSARFNAFGQCVIPYMQIIDHYKRLWDPEVIPDAVNGIRVQVSNDENFLRNHYPCSSLNEAGCVSTISHLRLFFAFDIWIMFVIV